MYKMIIFVLAYIIQLGLACDPPKYCPSENEEFICPSQFTSDGVSCTPRCFAPQYFDPQVIFYRNGKFDTCENVDTNEDCIWIVLGYNQYEYSFEDGRCCFGTLEEGEHPIFKITPCTSCDPGFELQDIGFGPGICVECPINFAKPLGNDKCEKCPFGSLPLIGGTRCREQDACEPGKGREEGVCKPCAEGFTNDGTHKDCQCFGQIVEGTCQPCPGEYKDNECVPCSEGYRSVNGVCKCYGEIVEGECRICEGILTDTVCIQCEQYGLFWNGTKCTVCPLGSYREADTCQKCEPTTLRPECVSGILSRDCTTYSHEDFTDISIYSRCGGRDESCSELNKCSDSIYRAKCQNMCYGLYHNVTIERFGHRGLQQICPDCYDNMLLSLYQPTLYESKKPTIGIKEFGAYNCEGEKAEGIHTLQKCAEECDFNGYPYFTFRNFGNTECTCVDSPCLTKHNDYTLFGNVKFKYVAQGKCPNSYPTLDYININIEECAKKCLEHYTGFLRENDMCICQDACPPEELQPFDGTKYEFYNTGHDSYAMLNGNYCGEECLQEWEGSASSEIRSNLVSYSIIPNRCPIGQGRHITKHVECTPSGEPIQLDAFNKDECMLKCISETNADVQITFDGKCLCNSCIDGQALAYHEGNCQTCEPGTYSDDFMPTCQVCRGRSNTTSCTECETGFPKLVNDAYECGTCDPGQEYDYASESCTQCTGITYSDGSHACKKCYKLSASHLFDRCTNECLPGSEMCICPTSRQLTFDNEGQSSSKTHTYSGEPQNSPGLCMSEDYIVKDDTRQITPAKGYDFIIEGECRGNEVRVYPTYPTGELTLQDKAAGCYDKCTELYPSYPGFVVYDSTSTACYCELEQVGSTGCGEMYNQVSARRYDIMHGGVVSAYDQCQKNECVQMEVLQNERQYWRTRALSNLFPTHFASPYVTKTNVNLMQKLGIGHYNKFNSHHENGMKGDQSFEDLHVSLAECEDYAKQRDIHLPKTLLDWYYTVNEDIAITLAMDNDELFELAKQMFYNNSANQRGTCFQENKIIWKYKHTKKCGTDGITQSIDPRNYSTSIYEMFPKYKELCETQCQGKKYMSIKIENFDRLPGTRWKQSYSDHGGVRQKIFSSSPHDLFVGTCYCADECEDPPVDSLLQYVTYEHQSDVNIYFVPVEASKSICAAAPHLDVHCVLRMPTIEQQNTYIIDYLNTTGDFAGIVPDDYNPMKCPSYEGGCLCKQNIQYDGDFYDHHGLNMSKHGLETYWNGDERAPLPWEPYTFLHMGYCTQTSFFSKGSISIDQCALACSSFKLFIISVDDHCYCILGTCESTAQNDYYLTYSTHETREEWRMCDNEQECNNGCVPYSTNGDHDTFAANCMGAETIRPAVQYLEEQAGFDHITNCHDYSLAKYVMGDPLSILAADFVYQECCAMWDINCSNTDMCFDKEFFDGTDKTCGQTYNNRRCVDASGTVLSIGSTDYTCETLPNQVCFPRDYHGIYLQNCNNKCFKAYHDCTLHIDNADNEKVYDKCFSSTSVDHPNTVGDESCEDYIVGWGGLAQCNSQQDLGGFTLGSFITESCPLLCYGLLHNKNIEYTNTQNDLQMQCLLEDYNHTDYWAGQNIHSCSDISQSRCQQWPGEYLCCKQHCDALCEGCGHSRRLDAPSHTDTSGHKGRSFEDLHVNMTTPDFTPFDRQPWIDAAREIEKNTKPKDGKYRRLNEEDNSYVTHATNAPTQTSCTLGEAQQQDTFNDASCAHTCSDNETHISQLHHECVFYKKLNCLQGTQMNNTCECNQGWEGDLCDSPKDQCDCPNGEHCENIAIINTSNFHVKSPVQIWKIEVEQECVQIHHDTYEQVDTTIQVKLDKEPLYEIFFDTPIQCQIILYDQNDEKIDLIPYNVQDAKKCKINKCTCNNGKGAQGVECPTHGMQKCSSCDEKYYLEEGTCTFCDAVWYKGCTETVPDCAYINHMKARNCETNYEQLGDWLVYNGNDLTIQGECTISRAHVGCVENETFHRVEGVDVRTNGSTVEIFKPENIQQEQETDESVVQCPPGTYLNERKCNACEDGTFSYTYNMKECQTCPGQIINASKCILSGEYTPVCSSFKHQRFAERKVDKIQKLVYMEDCHCKENRINKLFLNSNCPVEAPQFDIVHIPNTSHYRLTRKTFNHTVNVSLNVRKDRRTYFKEIKFVAHNIIKIDVDQCKEGGCGCYSSNWNKAVFEYCTFLPPNIETTEFLISTVTDTFSSIQNIKVYQGDEFSEEVVNIEPYFVNNKHFIDYIQGCDVTFLHAIGTQVDQYMNIPLKEGLDHIHVIQKDNHIELETSTSQCILWTENQDPVSSYSKWNLYWIRGKRPIFMDINNDNNVLKQDHSTMQMPLKCYLLFERGRDDLGVNEIVCRRFLLNTLPKLRHLKKYKYTMN